MNIVLHHPSWLVGTSKSGHQATLEANKINNIGRLQGIDADMPKLFLTMSVKERRVGIARRTERS
jgi:hypothetical protein